MWDIIKNEICNTVKRCVNQINGLYTKRVIKESVNDKHEAESKS